MIRWLVAYVGPASGTWVQIAFTEFQDEAVLFAALWNFRRQGGRAEVFDLSDCWKLWAWTP